MGARYDRRAPTSAARTDAARTDAARTDAQIWDALDRGEDPTG
jgi:hypothetical protein